MPDDVVEHARVVPDLHVAAERAARRKRVTLIALSIVGLFAAWEVLTRLVAYTSDAYVRSDLIAVAPEVTGPIVAVAVHDNQQVHRGDLLLSIDPEPFHLEVAAAQAAVRQAAAQSAADQDNVRQADAARQSADAALVFAQETEGRVRKLVQDAFNSRAQFDAAEEALRRASAQVASAAADQAKARAMLVTDSAATARAEAALALAHWRLDRTTLKAPADGAVNNLTIHAGDMARGQQALVGIVDAGAWRIIANYKQYVLPHLRDGGTAWVWLDSHPWHLFRARIGGIGRGISRSQDAPGLLPYVAPTTDWIRLQRRFPVTLYLDNPPADLALFMGADARVVIFP